MRNRRLLVVLAVASIVAGACGSATPSTAPASVEPASAAPANPITINAHLYQPFTSFDPLRQAGATGGDQLVWELQWDTLAIYDQGNNVQMRLADSITPNADGTEWTVKLKTGAKWSDGTAFTSKDVVYSFELNANPNISVNAGLWTDLVGIKDFQSGASPTIAGITAPDDTTVVFKLSTPNGAFLNTLLNFRNYILPQQVLGDVSKMTSDQFQKLDFWQKPTVSIGPMKWVETVPDQYLAFEKNPDWYGPSLKFDKLIVKPIDASVAATQLSSGDLDIATVGFADLSTLEAAGLKTGTALATNPVQSDFNTSSSRMSDVRVRQAITYGCNRQAFVDSFYKGQGKVDNTYFQAPWVPTDGLNPYAFDPQKAKALLDAAGFDYSKPVVWMSWNKDNLERQSYLQNCQSNLAQIGVKVNIVNGTDVTTALWKKGDYDLQLYAGYPAVYDPDSLSLPLGCAGIGAKGVTSQPTTYQFGGSNNSNWCNPQFDQLMSQARQLSDQNARADLYHQASLLFNKEVPVLIDYIPPVAYAWSSKLTGVDLYGDPSLIFQNIANWQKAP